MDYTVLDPSQVAVKRDGVASNQLGAVGGHSAAARRGDMFGQAGRAAAPL